jgi:O-glycosyl hydrolase
MVLPGTIRIELINKQPVEAVAFVNPSGDKVVEIVNNASEPNP